MVYIFNNIINERLLKKKNKKRTEHKCDKCMNKDIVIKSKFDESL